MDCLASRLWSESHIALWSPGQFIEDVPTQSKFEGCEIHWKDIRRKEGICFFDLFFFNFKRKEAEEHTQT